MVATLADRAKSLPQKPGVYQFLNAAGVILYVGKAKNLRHRVSSYFQASRQLDGAKEKMVEQIARIEYIIVRSETEALLLESTLIKKHRPKYNILLKDDKNFQYIKIALNEKFPTVSTVRRMSLDGSRYFGPYTSGLSVRRTMRLLKRLFPYKSCANPPDVPCFDWQLNRCLGHQTGPGSRQRYQVVIQKLMRFLEGQTGDVLKNLKLQMRAAARAKDYEQAAIERDRLLALEHILEQQTVISPRGGHYDVLGLARHENLAAITLFQVRQGKLVQRDNFLLQQTAGQTDTAVVQAFIAQYYSQSTNHPTEVFSLVPVATDWDAALQLRIRQAQRGLKRKLAQTAKENAEDYIAREQVRWLSDERRAQLGLAKITEALKLPHPPKRIEMYDISNFQGQHAVGSMVVFLDGLPRANAYRKFKIKTVRGPNDVHMLAEMLRRRFAHQADAAWAAPDLILLDGGRPQLSTVLSKVKNLPAVPIAALAKQEEELFIPKRAGSIRLPHDSPGLHLVQRIRDEAHRFAIGYYRKTHTQAATRSRLDEVPGLGPTNKKRLLKKFGTVAGIRQASDAAITEIVGPKVAVAVRDTLG